MGPFLLSDQQRTKVQRVERITELVSEGPLEVSGPASYSAELAENLQQVSQGQSIQVLKFSKDRDSTPPLGASPSVKTFTLRERSTYQRTCPVFSLQNWEPSPPSPAPQTSHALLLPTVS